MAEFPKYSPPPSRQDIISARRRERMAENVKNFTFGNTIEQQQRTQFGAMLGTMFANKFNPPTLTESEERALQVQEQFKTLQAARKRDPGYADMNAEDRQLAGMEDLAQSLADAGDIVRSAELAVQAHRIRRDRRKSDAEYEKLVEETQAKRLDTNIKFSKELRDQAGEYGAFVVPELGGSFDFTTDEPRMVTGRVNEDGMLETDEGEVTRFMTAEDYSRLRTKIGDSSSATGGGSDKKFKGFFSAVGQSERAAQRVAQQAVGQQVSIMEAVADDFEKYIATGRDPATFLDGAGKVIDFTSNLASTFKSLGGVIFNVPITNEKGEVIASDSRSWSNKFGETLTELIQLPPGIVEASPEAARYRSAVSELTYATARANEPAARQLSDADYRHNLQIIGANAADPEKLRQVILANLTRKMRTYQSDVQTIGDIAEQMGLDREEGLSAVYGKKARSDFVERSTSMIKRYQDLEGVLAEGKYARGGQTSAVRTYSYWRSSAGRKRTGRRLLAAVRRRTRSVYTPT